MKIACYAAEFRYTHSPNRYMCVLCDISFDDYDDTHTQNDIIIIANTATAERESHCMKINEETRTRFGTTSPISIAQQHRTNDNSQNYVSHCSIYTIAKLSWRPDTVIHLNFTYVLHIDDKDNNN